MIFPIGDTQVKGGHKPLFTYTFIVLNILLFALQVSQPGNLICEFAVMPENIKNGTHLYTLLTSLFMHGSYMHIIGNLLFLWVFADNIEAVIGNFRFVLFYLGGGVVASLAHIYLGTPAADTLPCCMPCDGCDGPAMCAGFIPSLGAMVMLALQQARLCFVVDVVWFHLPALRTFRTLQRWTVLSQVQLARREVF